MAKETKVKLSNGYYDVSVVCFLHEVECVKIDVLDKENGQKFYFVLYWDEVKELAKTLQEYLQG
jgi:hypothetical protein